MKPKRDAFIVTLITFLDDMIEQYATDVMIEIRVLLKSGSDDVQKHIIRQFAGLFQRTATYINDGDHALLTLPMKFWTIHVDDRTYQIPFKTVWSYITKDPYNTTILWQWLKTLHDLSVSHAT
jgi:hypothetical protein